jgi:transposase
MAQVEYIKDLYEIEGLSLREIARRTGKDFRTVQKYAYQDDWNPPVKWKMDPADYPVLGKHIYKINEWLEQDGREPRKQRHTISRVFQRLRKEEGFTGSYSSVKRYVNRKWAEMAKHNESFLPLSQPPGYAQVDFGEFKYYDALGCEHKGHALVVSFPHSNSGWMQVFPAENQECLLTGLQRIFRHIGGTPVRMRMDNMSTAVARILKGSERVITDGFHRFMLHYRFRADFCTPNKGNEKGSVENKVGYTRRNMLVPVPAIADFATYNEDLLKLCDEDHEREHYKHGELISELWEEDRRHLLALPDYEYDVFSYESAKVNSYGYIKVDRGSYGLSPEMRNMVVQVKIYYDKIEAYYDHVLLKTFVRSYVRGNEDCDWKDYLPTLIKKPGATEHTRFFNQMPKLWQDHLRSVEGRERKAALLLLSEIVQEGNEALCDEALELAWLHGRPDNDSIRQCYLLISKPENYPQPLQFVDNPPLLNYHPDLSIYDGLTGGVAK